MEKKLRTPRAARFAAGARPTVRSRPPCSPFFQQEMPDIDALDRENPLAVTEYVNDIFSYWSVSYTHLTLPTICSV